MHDINYVNRLPCRLAKHLKTVKRRISNSALRFVKVRYFVHTKV